MIIAFHWLVCAAFAGDPVLPTGHPSVLPGEVPPGAMPVPAPASFAQHGTVLETMDAGGYTFVRVKGDTEEYWAAGPPLAVKVGDMVMLGTGIEMRDFYSRSLERSFPVIWFVETLGTGVIEASLAPPPPPVAVSLMMPANGGYGIVEVYAQSATLAGKVVKVRGKVVRVSNDIMGRNWLHLQDGTGSAASSNNDLVVTTSARVKAGDTVVVEGPLVADKDFGAGYRFAVIVEDATVTVE